MTYLLSPVTSLVGSTNLGGHLTWDMLRDNTGIRREMVKQIVAPQ